MNILSTGLKVIAALALAGVAFGASAAPYHRDGYHRHYVRHHYHHRHQAPVRVVVRP